MVGAAGPAPSREEVIKALSQRHGEELQKKFSGARAAVCGLGGLGSNIALALARAGLGTLHLIDFDRVELSNLNRQQYSFSQLGLYKTEALRENILSAAPYCRVIIDTVRIKQFFKSALHGRHNLRGAGQSGGKGHAGQQYS
mgnify:CR=1 FL=1